MKKRQPKEHPARHLFANAGIVALTVLSIAALAGTAYYSRSYLTSPHMAAVISSVLVDLTNEDRADNGLSTLTVNPKLVVAAQAKADDMAAKGYFAHTSPDGTSSWQWFKDANYAYASAGENLAVHFSDSEDVEEAWMDSPTHRANILSGKFTEIGIATAVGTYEGKKTVFVVQMFGRPAAGPAVQPVRETVPQNPSEPAIVTTEPADVLGTTDEELPLVPAKSEPAPAASVEDTTVEPAPVPAETVAVSEAPVWAPLATSPESMLRTIYLVLAFALLGALLLTTGLEFKRHHMRHVMAFGLVLVMMGGLFFVAERLVFAEPVIGQASVPSST